MAFVLTLFRWLWTGLCTLESFFLSSFEKVETTVGRINPIDSNMHKNLLKVSKITLEQRPCSSVISLTLRRLLPARKVCFAFGIMNYPVDKNRTRSTNNIVRLNWLKEVSVRSCKKNTLSRDRFLPTGFFLSRPLNLDRQSPVEEHLCELFCSFKLQIRSQIGSSTGDWRPEFRGLPWGRLKNSLQIVPFCYCKLT